MILQNTKEIDYKSNLVFILNSKSKNISNFPNEFKAIIKDFIKSDKDFDYLKNTQQTIFLIKGKENSEKNRVNGCLIREKLGKDETTIYFIGEQNTLLDVAEGFYLSSYQFLKYLKDKQEKKHKIENIFLVDSDKKHIEKLNNILKGVYWTRDMVNEPVSFLTASQFSIEIKQLFENLTVSVEVFEKSKIESLKMGGLIAVNKGSIEPPTFTIIEYKPKKPTNKKPIVLVGKGVVYDTGGLSLKPTASSMDLMKSDMAGAAAVVGAIYASALNRLNTHIIGLIPATDNRPGMEAYTPGDIITMFDGTTVEVLNTDAEGRMILADALAYSKKFDPELVIDLATLTGAAVVAIGTKASCVMGNANQNIINDLVESGNSVHERLVQLPFWDEYYEDVKSSIADLKNIGGKYAGMITAGKFLEHFVSSPYIHIDIAGPSFLEAPENYKGKGGTGVGVRLLHDFFENFNKKNK